MVILEPNENIESALKKFRRKVQQDQILKDVKKHEFFQTKMQKVRSKKLKKTNKKK